MTESVDKEPTMEEILSSIRRIISEEDDETKQDAAPQDDEDEDDFVAESPDEDGEILELTERVEDEPEPQAAEADPGDGDILVLDREPEPAPLYEAEPAEELEIEVSDIGEPEPEPEIETAGIGDADDDFSGPGAAPVDWTQESAMSDRIVSDQAAGAAASAFSRLASSMRVSEDDKTLEGIVRELLRPMLKEWLDANLPGIVERKVREEVERISRQA